MPEDDREDPVGEEGDAGDDRVQGHVKGEPGPEVWFGILEQWPQIHRAQIPSPLPLKGREDTTRQVEIIWTRKLPPYTPLE